MKQDNINYTIVGAFVFAMALLLIIVLYFITGRVVDSDRYYTVLDDVTGLIKGTSITYKGYKVGQLLDINPVQNDNKTRFKLDIALRSGWKITQGSTIMISKPGVLSDSQLNISEGSLPGVLNVGDEIKGIAAEDIMSVMKSLTRKLREDMGTFTSDMTKQLPELTSNLNLLVVKLQKSTDVIDTFFNKNNQRNVADVIEKAGLVMNNLQSASGTINKLVLSNEKQLDTSVDKISESISVVNKKLEVIINQFEMSSQNINDFSNQIKNNPGVIIRNKSVSDRAVR